MDLVPFALEDVHTEAPFLDVETHANSVQKLNFQKVAMELNGEYILYIQAPTRENLSSEVYEQQRRRPACACAQSDQHLCYSLIRTYDI